MPHFALVTTDGDALGTVELGRPDWPDGTIIHRGDEPNLRVVGQLATDDSERSTCSSSKRPDHFRAGRGPSRSRRPTKRS